MTPRFYPRAKMFKNILAIIFIAAAVGIFVSFARPVWEDASKLGDEKATLENVQAEFQRLRKVRDDLMAKYNSIPPEDLGKLTELLPPAPASGALLVNLENLTKLSGILLKRLDVKEKQAVFAGLAAPPPGPYEELPFEITVSGSYEGFRAFLSSLEQNLRLLDVEEISFTASEAATYEFVIRASAYWQKP